MSGVDWQDVERVLATVIDSPESDRAARLESRLNELTGGGKLLVEKMSPDQKTALRKLQDFERLVAVKYFKTKQEMFDPVEERIQQELFSRKVQ